MMAIYNQRHVWLTFLGQTLFENLNPFWFYCETSNSIPRVVLFYEREQETHKERLVRGFAAISRRFVEKPVNIEWVEFDDEGVSGFVEKCERVFRKAGEEKLSIIVDVSPTAWSFVPIYLIKTAGIFSDRVSSVVYLQYRAHRSREMPYALVPRISITVHDLLKEPGFWLHGKTCENPDESGNQELRKK